MKHSHSQALTILKFAVNIVFPELFMSIRMNVYWDCCCFLFYKMNYPLHVALKLAIFSPYTPDLFPRRCIEIYIFLSDGCKYSSGWIYNKDFNTIVTHLGGQPSTIANVITIQQQVFLVCIFLQICANISVNKILRNDSSQSDTSYLKFCI